MDLRNHLSIFLLICFSFANAQAFTIGIFADMNGTECQPKYPGNSLRIFKKMLGAQKLDHIISTGDVVHGECPKYKGSGSYSTVVKAMWDEFDKNFFQLARTTRGLMPIISPGNHDAPYVSAGGSSTYLAENAGFKNYWSGRKDNLNVDPIRVTGAEDDYPYYWAYKKDDILFIVLQSTRTSSLANSSAQKKWLTAVLNSEEAKSSRYKIAYGHIPPYAVLDPSVGSKAKEVLTSEQVGKSKGLMDTLLDHGVQMLIVGHSHAPYPGQLIRKSDQKTMKILSMPCGHSPRVLYSQSTRAPRGYALLTIDDSNSVTMNIRTEQSNLVPYSYFPTVIPQASSLVRYEKIAESQYR